MFLANRWEDISTRARQSDVITITRGRKDENTKTPPATCSLTLDNSDGAFSLRNPLGPWYGELGRNNPIEVAKNLVTDAFSRTVSGTFGATDTGQVWARLNGTSAAAVTLAGGTLSMVPGDINHWYVQGVTQADARVTAEFSIATGNITGERVIPVGVFVRGSVTGPESVYVRIQIETDESITFGINSSTGTTYVAQTATGITHVSGQHLSVSIQADGETVSAKIWRTLDGEPLNWQLTAMGLVKASGLVGFRSALGAASTNNPLVVTLHRFVVDSVRFTGEVSSLPAASDTTGRNQYVPIEAAGIMRRLGQGQPPTQSAIRRGILASSNLVAYWPCEEGENATSISSATAGVLPMAVSPAPRLPEFAASTEFVCSAPLPTLNATTWVGYLPNYDTSAGKVQARVLISTPVAGVAADEVLIRIVGQGTGVTWDLTQLTAGSMRLFAYDAAGTSVFASGAIGFANNGKNLRVGLSLTQNGADVDYTMSVLEPGAGAAGVFSGVAAGLTFGKCVYVATNVLGNFTDAALGHITFQNDVTSIFEAIQQLNAHDGERALTRIKRLSTENDVPLTYIGAESDTTKLGYQRVQTYLDLVREAGDSDVGTVYERRGVLGVAYRTRTSIYAQASAVTLDLAKFEVGTPFQPVDDDQPVRNDITAKRKGGAEYRAVLETGPMSVLEPPDGNGRVTDTPELSLQADSQLYDLAYWLLALGTVDQARYPNLKVDLDADAVIKAGLEPAVLDLDVDDRFSVINAIRARIYEPIHQIVRGYTEHLGNFSHTFALNLSPSEPFDVGVLDDGLFRLDSGTSSLTNALGLDTTGAVSVTTTNASDLWAPAAGDLPQDLLVGGERITINAVSGASSPQTFTISARAVNGVRKSHVAGTPVHAANPWRLGL